MRENDAFTIASILYLLKQVFCYFSYICSPPHTLCLAIFQDHTFILTPSPPPPPLIKKHSRVNNKLKWIFQVSTLSYIFVAFFSTKCNYYDVSLFGWRTANLSFLILNFFLYFIAKSILVSLKGHFRLSNFQETFKGKCVVKWHFIVTAAPETGKTLTVFVKYLRWIVFQK